jgi:hypothetical protein
VEKMAGIIGYGVSLPYMRIAVDDIHFVGSGDYKRGFPLCCRKLFHTFYKEIGEQELLFLLDTFH